MQGALSELAPADAGQVIVAYEPIWAIGEHGTPATVDQVAGVMALINEVVTTVGGSARAVLYGGSVNLRNATELLSDPNTHGLFIGRAAWDAAAFIALLESLRAPAPDREVRQPSIAEPCRGPLRQLSRRTDVAASKQSQVQAQSLHRPWHHRGSAHRDDLEYQVPDSRGACAVGPKKFDPKQTAADLWSKAQTDIPNNAQPLGEVVPATQKDLKAAATEYKATSPADGAYDFPVKFRAL